jgi:NADH:ubiquinone oxidoreductase subunit K
MIGAPGQFVTASLVLVALLLVVGLYCLVVSRNLIRILIGLEILTKAVTLLLALGGYASGRMAQAQSFIVVLIAIEVVVIAVAAGIVIGAHEHQGDLDARRLRQLRG